MISVIVPQWGHSALTRACVQTFLQTHPEGYEVLVVDDGSGPEDVDAIRALRSDRVRVLFQNHRGVSSAWNLGAVAASGGVLVFLNNDVLSQGPWLHRLVQPILQGRAELTGVAWRNETGVRGLQAGPWVTSRFLQGWCWAVRAETFHQLGRIDETMTCYWSDTDFQLRLIKDRGEDVRVCVNDLPIRHHGHQTTKMMADRRQTWCQDRNEFLRKWSLNNETAAVADL